MRTSLAGRFRGLVLLLTACLVASGCGEDTSRLDALGDLAEKQAIPGYTRAVAVTGALDEAVRELCQSTTPASVSAARTALLDVRQSLAVLEAFRHGPAMDERDQGRINTQIEPDAIEELILTLDPAVFDAHYVSTSIGATKRGMYAVEYMLFVDGSAQASSLSLADVDRCAYLSGVSGAITENVTATLNGWTTGGDIKLPYIDVLKTPKNAQDNINVTVETSVFLLRKIINMELAPALGLVGTEPDLSGLAEGESGQGLTLLSTRLESIRRSLVGSDGLSSLLSDDLVERLQGEIDVAQAGIKDAIDLGDSSLEGTVLAHPAAVEEIHDQIVAIERTVATEVVGELGVVVGFSDADGDSAN